MAMDDEDGRKVVYDFGKEVLDSLSVDELEARIEQLRLEISRCEVEISGKQSTKEAAEGFFRK